MLVVLAILVLLVSMVVPRIIGSQKKGLINTAKSQIGMFRGALDTYAVDCGKYPSTEQGLNALVQKPADMSQSTAWNGPYVTGDIPKDPWGGEYQYEYPPTRGRGDTPDIWSYGPDGEDNTEDDICSWTSGPGGASDKVGAEEKPAETRRPARRETRTEPRAEPRRSSDRVREAPAPSRAPSRSAPRPERKPSPL
jgi:general secretion pathway protein G